MLLFGLTRFQNLIVILYCSRKNIAVFTFLLYCEPSTVVTPFSNLSVYYVIKHPLIIVFHLYL